MSDKPKTRKTPIYREMAGSPMYLGQSREMSDAKGEFIGWHEEPICIDISEDGGWQVIKGVISVKPPVMN